MDDKDLAAAGPATFLFMVREGPTHTIDELEPLCGLLSRRFHGELWSYGSYEADAVVGRMRIRVLKDRSSRRAVNFVTFARAVLGRARQLGVEPRDSVVVTSYDPFKGGLLAWLASRILKGKFLCEVNGVFGNPENFSHLHSAIWRRLRVLQMRLLGSFVLRRADAVRLLFAEQLHNFVRLGSGTVVRHFMDFTNTARFLPGTEEPIILAAGYPFMVKGIDLLVQAFCEIAPRHPEWKLVLIGHLIPDELRRRGIEHPQILALRGMPQRELAAWVGRCSILALASRSEAMGRVLLEAAAAGKCRIAARVGGIPTVITHDVDGFLFEKGNFQELARGLEYLITHDSYRRRLGAAALQRAQVEFTPDAYLELFGELVSATLAATPSIEN